MSLGLESRRAETGRAEVDKRQHARKILYSSDATSAILIHSILLGALLLLTGPEGTAVVRPLGQHSGVKIGKVDFPATWT